MTGLGLPSELFLELGSLSESVILSLFILELSTAASPSRHVSLPNQTGGQALVLETGHPSLLLVLSHAYSVPSCQALLFQGTWVSSSAKWGLNRTCLPGLRGGSDAVVPLAHGKWQFSV